MELAEIPDSQRLNPLANKTIDNDLEFKRELHQVLGDDAQAYESRLLEKAAEMNSALALVGILSFISAFQFSVGPVMWVLFSEIFPISVRGIAIPFFTIITSLTSYYVQKFFPWQLEHMTMSSIFLFYAATVTVGLLILFFTLVETKNMSIEQIQAALTSGASPRDSAPPEVPKREGTRV